MRRRNDDSKRTNGLKINKVFKPAVDKGLTYLKLVEISEKEEGRDSLE